MNEWNIQTRASTCAACQVDFTNGQPYHTVLFDERHGLRRSDICEPCWQKQSASPSLRQSGFVSHWQGVFEVPPPTPEPIQKENAESLLRKLIHQNNPRHAPAAFILAVMLERKRLLKVKETIKQDGRRIFVYEHPSQGDVFTIPDPDLKLDQLEQVQKDVAQLLEHGIAESEANPAPPAEATGPDSPASPAETTATL